CGSRPLITGLDGRKTVELITAIYKAGFEKRTVSLPIRPDDEYYTADGIGRHAIRFYEKAASIENFVAADISVGNYGEKK
ncbi:MAG TPA: oxidoreductase, partial [Lachnoclostridium sp.]|nr:oxidoreductase [Lachnoclostridium sp.]